MNEQQARDLVDQFTARAVRNRDSARRCAHPEAALVNEAWAAGLEEAAADLVALLDGPQAAGTFRERLGGPGRSVEDVRAEAQDSAAGGTQ